MQPCALTVADFFRIHGPSTELDGFRKLRFVGDFRETSKFHPSLFYCSHWPRPHPRLCQPFSEIPGVQLCCHTLPPISRLRPLPGAVRCLLMGILDNLPRGLHFSCQSCDISLPPSSPPPSLCSHLTLLHTNPTKPHPYSHLIICLMPSLDQIRMKPILRTGTLGGQSPQVYDLWLQLDTQIPEQPGNGAW